MKREHASGWRRAGVVQTIYAICALAVLASITAFVGTAAAQESRLDAIVKRDKLLVATTPGAPPNVFVDEKGQLTGFEVEFAKLVAKYILGDEKKIEFIQTNVEGRFPAVLSGKADFGIATATIYPERTVRIAFTRPYMDSGTIVVVKSDSPLKAIADLDQPSISLSSVNSAPMMDRAKRYNSKGSPLFFDSDNAAFLALQTGRAQAYQADIPVANGRIADGKGEYRLLPGKLGNVNGNALFMKPGDFTLWLCLDTIVGELVSGSRYDEYAALYRKWYKADPPPQRFYQ
jgi:polar amino acid transport system substrate-binding protein